MTTLGKQFLLHNANKTIDKLKQDDPMGRKLAKVEEMAHVASPTVEADNFKLSTGLQLDKGIAYSELFIYKPTLRSEVNVLKKTTTFKMTNGPLSTTYSRDFNSKYNFNLVLTTTFE